MTAPLAGAVDLAPLKNKPTAEQENQAVMQTLVQHGLVCPCGSAIEHEGVETVVVAVGNTQTPTGPQRGIGVTRQSFCSTACPLIVPFQTAAIQQDTLAVVMRPLPAATWLKKPGGGQHAQPGA